eukprot:1644194-Pyramimonas_sp.AAC.1
MRQGLRFQRIEADGFYVRRGWESIVGVQVQAHPVRSGAEKGPNVSCVPPLRQQVADARKRVHEMHEQRQKAVRHYEQSSSWKHREFGCQGHPRHGRIGRITPRIGSQAQCLGGRWFG